MNINFDDYKISSTVTEKDAFIYQCTTCNKKVRTKMQLIDVRFIHSYSLKALFFLYFSI